MSTEHEHKDPIEIESAMPANPLDVPAKAGHSDSDHTAPDSLPTLRDELEESLEEGMFTSEHHISEHHAEPTDVTDTTNDEAIDGEYIDVGGGG